MAEVAGKKMERMKSAAFVVKIGIQRELRRSLIRLVSTLCPSSIISRRPRTVLITLTVSLDCDDDDSMAHPDAAIDARLTRHARLLAPVNRGRRGFQSKGANFLYIWLICAMYAAATSCIYPEQLSTFNSKCKAPIRLNLSRPRW